MNSEQMSRAVNEAVGRIKSGTLKILAIEWRRSIIKNFVSKGRPEWEKRKKISKKQKGTNILVISGAMKNVSTVSDFSSYTISLKVDPRAKAYAKIHNEGGTINMPARKIKFRKNKSGRTVFASSKNKRITKETTGRAYVVKIPKREYTNIPADDYPRIISALKQQLSL